RSMSDDLHKRNIKHLLVANKTDLANEEVKVAYKNFGSLLFVSARHASDIEKLKSKLTEMVLEGNVQSEGAIVTNARHFDSLQKIAISVHEIRQALDNNIPGDLVALDIRRCLHFLGEITGEITHEDQLDYIFSKFCIGK
ncbi:MAG: tRNA uridine-5-carboxymethylaminomethyl(34) synthesis GTPase MnmE, partial [Flavitalea sp.]